MHVSNRSVFGRPSETGWKQDTGNGIPAAKFVISAYFKLWTLSFELSTGEVI
jgi:hypothetical protein